MNGKKPSLGKSEEFQSKFTRAHGSLIPSGDQVAAVVAHAQWNLGWRRGMEIADPHLYRAPTSCLLGNEIDTDRAMKFGGEIFVEEAFGKVTGIDPCFEADYLLGEQRCYFRVGEDTPRCVEISGSAIPARRLRRLAKSTGSLSKDMLWATSSGIASQRRRSLSRAGRRRHFVTRSVQFIRHCLALTSRPSKQEQAGEPSHLSAVCGAKGTVRDNSEGNGGPRMNADKWQICRQSVLSAGFSPCGFAPWFVPRPAPKCG